MFPVCVRSTDSAPARGLIIIVGRFLVLCQVYVLAFFAILHCWFNAFAEITRFADRLFYEDWQARMLSWLLL